MRGRFLRLFVISLFFRLLFGPSFGLLVRGETSGIVEKRDKEVRWRSPGGDCEVQLQQAAHSGRTCVVLRQRRNRKKIAFLDSKSTN